MVEGRSIRRAGNKFKVFTTEEFQKVWDTVGGHAGQLFQLYEELRCGLPLDQAIDNRNRYVIDMLNSVIEAPEGCDYEDMIQKNVNKDVALDTVIRRRRNFLKMLRDCGLCKVDTEVSMELYQTVQYCGEIITKSHHCII